jgi:outer membrane protein OmpA-like peptidoglycan-associated protein
MRRPIVLLILAPLVAITAGCASKKYVQGELVSLEDRTNVRLDEIAGQVEANQTTLDEHETQIAELSKTAREALERAIAAGKLAEGKFLYETVLTDDAVRFGFDRDDLSPEATSALGEFAGRLAEEGHDVYVEIQGHTDATGTPEYNLELGARRAETVRRHLKSETSLPLHRIAVISYGESEPLVPNDTREGRAQNRRVALVVLR